jgi:hypothetical protein
MEGYGHLCPVFPGAADQPVGHEKAVDPAYVG